MKEMPPCKISDYPIFCEPCSILKDEDSQKQLFANINLDTLKDDIWREKVLINYVQY
jgi:hypothetical protein